MVRKLHDDQILEIYNGYKKGVYSQSSLARIAGVSRQAIHQILNANGYRCLSGRKSLITEGKAKYDEHSKSFTDGRE